MNFLSYRLFFKALNNEGRFRLVESLRSGPLCVSEICKKTGFKQSRVSRGLVCLKNCGFVSCRRQGKKIFYKLDSNTVTPFLELIDKYVRSYHRHLKACRIVGDRNE